MHVRALEVAVDQQGRLAGIEGEGGPEVLGDEAAPISPAHTADEDHAVLPLAPLNDLGSELAKYLHRGIGSPFLVDDASLRKVGRAEQS
jgi:hypothetical protein